MAFDQLSKVMHETVEIYRNPGKIIFTPGSKHDFLSKAIVEAEQKNPWFSRDHILFAMESICRMLAPGKIEKWLMPYQRYLKKETGMKDIGVVMAGNIPMIGFHDFLCVLLAEHRFIGKLSSQDDVLMPAIARLLTGIEPALEGRIEFRTDKLGKIDAVIATGSNNTSRYFEYYFREYPHIIRKNRNSIAVLTGNETEEEMQGIASDIMQYFGLGCRNVSRIFIPEGYELATLTDSFRGYSDYFNHNKYRNNYDYYKAIFMINNISYQDNGFLLLREDDALATPVSVVNYSYYQSIDDVNDWITSNYDKLQCVVCHDHSVQGSIRPGSTQEPALADYADGVDTMAFLMDIH